MNRKKYKFSLLALIMVLFYVVSSSAYASVKVFVGNTHNKNVSMAFRYRNKHNGRWTTSGWYIVDAKGFREIKLKNANPKSTVYYYGCRGVGHSFYDKSNSTRDSINRYVSSDSFDYDFNGKPSSGRNIRLARFVKAKWDKEYGGYSIITNYYIKD